MATGELEAKASQQLSKARAAYKATPSAKTRKAYLAAVEKLQAARNEERAGRAVTFVRGTG